VTPFDSTKGILSGVSWTAIVKPFVDVQLTNDTSQEITGNVSVTNLKVGFTAPDGSTGSATGSGSILFTVEPSGQPGSTEFFELDGSLSLPSTTVAASKLSFYEGPGQASFTFTQPTFSLGKPPAGVSEGSAFSGFDLGGTVTVTYTYTPAASTTPEPSSLTLLGLGSLGLLGYGWRRRKRAAS
jgi:hypothetical protein